MNAFANCLQEIRALNITEIAFPFNIGCGMAGGSWPKYKKMLIEHLSNHDIKVVVYKFVKTNNNKKKRKQQTKHDDLSTKNIKVEMDTNNNNKVIKTIYLEDTDKQAFLHGYKNVIPKNVINDCVLKVKPLLIKNPPIKVYGKIHKQPRTIGFFSDESIGYRYSKQLMKSQPLLPCLKSMLNTVNVYFKSNYNGILVNLYNSGKEHIGKHSDDETKLTQNGVGVLAISVGAVRKFRFRKEK